MYHVKQIKEEYQIPGFWEILTLDRLLTIQISNYIHIGLNKFSISPIEKNDILWNFQELWYKNKYAYASYKRYLCSRGITINDNPDNGSLETPLNGIEVSWNV